MTMGCCLRKSMLIITWKQVSMEWTNSVIPNCPLLTSTLPTHREPLIFRRTRESILRITL